jgi:hypothetical protein
MCLTPPSQPHPYPFCSKLADSLTSLCNCYIQLASVKDVKDDERRGYLYKACRYNFAACEVLIDAACEVAKKAGNTAFTDAVKRELEARVTDAAYPKGVVSTTAVGLAASAGAGAGAGAGASGLGAAVVGDVDVRVFRTLFETFGSRGTLPVPAPAPGGPKTLDLGDVCEIIDTMITRGCEMRDDLTVSVDSVASAVRAEVGQGGEEETGFGAAGAAAAAAPAAMVVMRRAAPKAEASAGDVRPAADMSAGEGEEEGGEGAPAKRARTE